MNETYWGVLDRWETLELPLTEESRARRFTTYGPFKTRSGVYAQAGAPTVADFRIDVRGGLGPTVALKEHVSVTDIEDTGRLYTGHREDLIALGPPIGAQALNTIHEVVHQPEGSDARDERINPMVERQFADVLARWPVAWMRPLPWGPVIIRVPDFEVSGPFDHKRVTVVFEAPNGFPCAQPQHFWTVEDVRTSEGRSPHMTNTANKIPGVPDEPVGRWWSWKLQAWHPNRDTLTTYLRVISNRLSMEPSDD